jgi:hypothetical protein
MPAPAVGKACGGSVLDAGLAFPVPYGDAVLFPSGFSLSGPPMNGESDGRLAVVVVVAIVLA